MKHLHAHIAASHAHLARGRVWCRCCARSAAVDPARGVLGALRHGWPRCCGRTMTIDSPEERVSLVRTRWRVAEPA